MQEFLIYNAIVPIRVLHIIAERRKMRAKLALICDHRIYWCLGKKLPLDIVFGIPFQASVSVPFLIAVSPIFCRLHPKIELIHQYGVILLLIEWAIKVAGSKRYVRLVSGVFTTLIDENVFISFIPRYVIPVQFFVLRPLVNELTRSLMAIEIPQRFRLAAPNYSLHYQTYYPNVNKPRSKLIVTSMTFFLEYRRIIIRTTPESWSGSIAFSVGNSHRMPIKSSVSTVRKRPSRQYVASFPDFSVIIRDLVGNNKIKLLVANISLGRDAGDIMCQITTL
ncbi:hypothetical protein TcasGA2_TC006418 [Tribolium castaneum]|uniref:Uncharacterized protein n=1 Tax=Tribolium castaneum TaxID=7070 RepID=D6WWQ0_TRICA|nr:hypothetical protein TcasGA2_TC006418 [Tribolium castaneum]